MENDKVQAITEWPVPKSVKEVQSISGFANIYCCFVPYCSCLAQQQALNEIQAAISKEPTLVQPNESKS
jgi:hypothetical protein